MLTRNMTQLSKAWRFDMDGVFGCKIKWFPQNMCVIIRNESRFGLSFFDSFGVNTILNGLA